MTISLPCFPQDIQSTFFSISIICGFDLFTVKNKLPVTLRVKLLPVPTDFARIGLYRDNLLTTPAVRSGLAGPAACREALTRTRTCKENHFTRAAFSVAPFKEVNVLTYQESNLSTKRAQRGYGCLSTFTWTSVIFTGVRTDEVDKHHTLHTRKRAAYIVRASPPDGTRRISWTGSFPRKVQ